MIGSIYPIGYAAPGAGEHLEQLMRDPDMRLFDIRWSPVSRWSPEWRRDNSRDKVGRKVVGLAERFGERYQHVPDLGNIAFRDKGEIQLANAEKGIPYVVMHLEGGYSIILLCACAKFDRCHRKIVTELLQAALPGVEVVMPPAPAAPRLLTDIKVYQASLDTLGEETTLGFEIRETENG